MGFNQGATDELRELVEIKKCLKDGEFTQLAAVRVDASGTSGATTTYVGVAKPGSDPAAAVWQIRKIEDDGNGSSVVSWAQTTNNDTDYLLYNKIWNNRLSYVYNFDTI